jgi:hypothetical protein
MTSTRAGNLGKLPYGNVIRSLLAHRAMGDYSKHNGLPELTEALRSTSG